MAAAPLEVVLPEASGPVALLLVAACLELRATQELCCDPHHYDVMRTMQDLEQALEYLLANHPKLLFAALPAAFGTFSKASKAALLLRKRHQQLAAAYQA